MSKATITMCMNTTGFGNASTLSTQRLNNPGGYFNTSRSRAQSGASGGDIGSPSLRTAASRKMRMPKFDMNLKDLFSPEEIANRPHTQPLVQTRQSPLQQHSPAYLMGSPRSTVDGPSGTQSFSQQRPQLNHQHSMSSVSAQQQQQHHQNQHQHQQNPHLPDPDSLSQPATSPSLAYPAPNQSSYPQNPQTFQPDFPFTDLDFLSDPSFTAHASGADLWGDLDLGFGTGGTAGASYFDGSGGGAGGGYETGWEAGGGGVDLFDGFFFGNGGGGGGGAG